MGRTAIRQAFLQLAGRGLIVHVPRCGWRVRTFDEGDLAAYLEVREVLENKALSLARPSPGRRRPAAHARWQRVTQAGALVSTIPCTVTWWKSRGMTTSASSSIATGRITHRSWTLPRPRLTWSRPWRDSTARSCGPCSPKDWSRARRELTRHIRAQRPIVGDLLQRIGQKENSAAADRSKTASSAW